MKSHTQPEDKKVMSNQVKEVCLKCYDKFLSEGYLDSKYSVIYDFLDKFNYINYSKQEKLKYYKEAQNLLIRNALNSNKKSSISLFERKNSLSVIFQSKVLILQDYFTELHNQNKSLKDILYNEN